MVCNKKGKISRKLLLFSTVGLLLLTSFSSPEGEKKSRTKLDLKGDVQSVIEISYKAAEISGVIKKGKRERETSYQKDQIFIFNIKGDLIEKIWYDSNGDYFKKWTWIYDDKGNVTEERTYEEDSTIYRKFTLKYDENANMIEENGYKTDGSLYSRRTLDYNSNNKTTEEINYDSNDGFKGKRTYNYDENDNLIQFNTYFIDNSLNTSLKYKYDDKGNRIEESADVYFFNSDRSFHRKQIFSYDDNGIMVGVNTYDQEDNPMGSVIYKFDEQGNKIEEIDHDVQSNQEVRTTYKYDENGSVIETISYEADGYTLKISNILEYDSNRNWTKKVKFINDIPEYLIERELVYF